MHGCSYLFTRMGTMLQCQWAALIAKFGHDNSALSTSGHMNQVCNKLQIDITTTTLVQA